MLTTLIKMKTPENDPVEVFAGTPVEAAMVKSLLDNAEIQSYLIDEIMGRIAPWYASAGGVMPVRVVVSNSDLELAMQVIRDYINATNGDQDAPQ